MAGLELPARLRKTDDLPQAAAHAVAFDGVANLT
jgi:hypothetical protein